jgi:bla regulator protein blaR1
MKIMKAWFLALAIVSIACVLCVAAQKKEETDSVSISMTGEFTDKQATGIYIKGDEENINLDWSVFLGNDGKVYKVTLNKGNISELYVDGEKVSNENIPQYAAATKPFLDNLTMQKELENLENEIEKKEEDIDQQTDEIDRISDRIDKAHEKLDNLRERQSIDLSAEIDKLAKLRDKNAELRDSISAQRDELSLERDKLSEKRDKIDNMDLLDKVLNKIVSDSKAAGIVGNSKSISFKLSNKEFIVNGKRQSDELYQKMKAKYVIESKYETGFLYRWKEKI